MRSLRRISTAVFFGFCLFLTHGVLGFWLLMALGVNSANSVRSDGPVESKSSLRGSATVLPQTEPFRDLKMMIPQSEEVLRLVLSCKDELCLFNSQKAPVVTQLIQFGLMEGKRQVRLHLKSTSDPKMQTALTRVDNSFGEAQKALAELQMLITEKAMPR